MRWIDQLRKEISQVFASFLFFFTTFNLINLTEGLRLEREGILPVGFWTLLLASLVVAKVILIVDHLPFVDLFPNRPLIYNILWKTGLYGLTIFLLRILDRWLPFYLEGPSLEISTASFLQMLNWPAFFAIQIWYLFLFFLFVFLSEISKQIGREKIYGLLFKPIDDKG